MILANLTNSPLGHIISPVSETNKLTITKRAARAKKVEISSEEVIKPPTELPSAQSIQNIRVLLDAFTNLINKISEVKAEFENLQKEVTEVKESWIKEQQNHELQTQERDKQEEAERWRNQELYEYETTLTRKRAEDEFAERKLKWEKELGARREEIEQDKKELADLRKQAASFEAEKERAVKEACFSLQKGLNEKFATERQLREQEIYGEKEVLGLKIATLTAENSKQLKEIESLKRALEEAARHLKEIAVKVIESGAPATKTASVQESVVTKS